MTDRYAVVGNPINHSKSPLIHSAFAAETRQDLDYTVIEAPLDGFTACVEAFRANGGKGLNVTAPFKLEALALATSRSEGAQCAKASNALKFDGNAIMAQNFDGVGLLRDILGNLDVAIRGRRVLLMGAGGAARGAILPLLEQQPAELVIVNRTLSKAHSLRDEFAAFGKLTAAGYPELSGSTFDIAINATSASLRGEMPPIEARVFGRRCCLAYELVYGKGLTPFLRLAKTAGVERVVDGVGMLVEQAAEAFTWWRGVRPKTRALIDRLTVPLI